MLRRHEWKKHREEDCDLYCDVHKCDECGTRLPYRVNLEDDDLTEYGISYDCNVQVAKNVMRI